MDRFCGNHVGQAFCGCVALWDQLPHDCFLHAMDGWRDEWMDDETNGWKASFRPWHPLLYVIF